MLFSSLPFLFYFLPCALGLYFLAPRRLKNAALLLSSLVFYAWGEPRFVLFMATAILQGYAAARLMERYPRRKRLFLTLSAVLSLGLLGYCKYADFLISGFNAVTGLSVPLLRITLPIGISFYTFQILSYVIDVYRGDAPAQRSLIDLAAYIAMFPQLVAGPIVRYTDVAPQLQSRTHTVQDAALGARRFVLGLGKKVLLANVLYELVTVYQQSGQKTVLLTWMYAGAYMMHVYFDFSGYSDMAIGLGRIMGFRFAENFNYPFISGSLTEFWRRWHISLGSWFRDYVYIPLGGNRCGLPRQILNLIIVWGLTGLWHGASWNYVLWGLYFFLFLVIEKFLLGEKQQRIPAVLRHLFLLIIVYFCWVIFRFRDAAALGMALRGLFGGGTAAAGMAVGLSLKNNIFLLLVACVACTPLTAKLWQRWKAAAQGDSVLAGNRLLRGAAAVWEVIHPVLLLLLAAMALAGDSYNPFLYFQF